MAEGARFKGIEIELHRFPGARVLRVVHPDRQEIGEHRHDWAYIGIHMLGRYQEIYDGGEAVMAGPSAVLHPAGRPHADVVESLGLETLTIEFDRAWLRLHGFDSGLDLSQVWTGGAVALASRRLARILGLSAVSETQIGSATAQFLRLAMRSERSLAPAWLDRVNAALAADTNLSTIAIARRLDLHPAWLARAYRAATGEGLQETVRRKRVEHASALLRRTAHPLADVAAAAGFCDQSHMNRGFRATLGRTPSTVRSEQHPPGVNRR